MSRKKFAFACLGILAALWLNGCSGGTTGSTSSGTTSLVITPSATTVDGSDSISVTANQAVTWSISGPGALSNTSASGATYTAPAAAASSQSVAVTATAGSNQTTSVTITIPAKPVITTAGTALNSAVGASFNVPLQVSGGIGPYAWIVTNGALPFCLTLNSTTGAITGSLTAACAGNYTVTFSATDSGTPTKLSATAQLSFTVTAAIPIVLPAALTPATASAGTMYTGSAAATGGISPLTYSVINGALPNGLTLNSSTGAITGTPTAGGTANFTIQAVDNFGDAPAAQAYTLVIGSGAATHFSVIATSATTITAGGTVNFTVTALDGVGNAVTGYAGTVKFTSTDTAAVLPSNATLINGVGGFQATLKTSGNQTITGTDTVTATIMGSTNAIAVNAGGATKLAVTAPSTATAGTAINVTVMAVDTYGNTVTGYTGTVHFTSTDTTASLPANTLLTNGAGTYSAGLKTAGSETVTATDTTTSSITGTSGTISVKAASASKLMVSAPATAIAGSPISVSVTAQDAYGNTAITYSGTVRFGSSDSAAALPGNSLLGSGTATFQATLKTGGTQTITAIDLSNSSITGASGNILVSAGTVARLGVSTPASAVAGSPFTVTVTAQDFYGNAITNYTGTIQFTKSDAGAGSVVPANYTFVPADNGQHTFTNSVTLVTAMRETVSATDTVTPAITGTSPSITVNASAATKFVVSTAGTTPAGVALGLSVSAQDTYGNTAASYTGTVHFTSTDSAAQLPVNSTLTSGTGNFQATLKTVGNQTITATDTANASITGISGPINVSNALIITTTSLPAGNIGVPYLQSLTAAGGTGTGYTFAETTNNLLPFGLSLAANGTISGSPNQFGTINFSAKVTDSGNNTATESLSILIYSALFLPSASSFPTGYTSVPYSASISGTGGSPSLSLVITSSLSPANGTLAANITGAKLTISGTPTTATAEAVSVKLTDTTTNNSITQTYNFSISLPTTPSLPAGSPGAAAVNQFYSGTITATGGVGPNYNFTWTINGSAIPGNNSSVSVGDGLSVSDSGGNQLSVSGTPTSTSTSPGVQFTAQVEDNATGLTSSTQTYTVVVNTASTQVSGDIAIANLCGNTGFTLPSLTLSLSTNPTQQAFSDINGNYSFSAIPSGTYTITPSYTGGPPGSSAVFYPASQTITVSNGSANVPTFYVALGSTVSGSVAYSGTHTGQIYADLLNNNCPGNGGSGTSISSKGSYSIQGVAPGSYTLFAWMDSTDLGLGQGIQNDSDPSDSTTTITVGTNNVTSANATMTNNDPITAPTIPPTVQSIYNTHQGVVIAYKPALDSNGIEAATSYDVAWSSSPALSSGSLASVTAATTVNYKALGKGTIWILNNSITGTSSFADGTSYYFEVRSRNAVGAGAWVVYGGAVPTGVTVNPPSGADTISGNVTIPSSVTVSPSAKLYVGFYSQTSGIYATEVSSPAVGSNNPFTVNVPSGTWQYFGILDQNNDGQIDTGDVSSTRGAQGGPPSVTITSSQNNYPSPTMINASVFAVIQSQYASNITSTGSTEAYGLIIGGSEGSKLPVSMQLTAATNPDVLVPMDISNFCANCGGGQFQNFQNLFSVAPAVGDTYTFTVTYSDGTTDTNEKAAVIGWDGGTTVAGPSAVATNLAPTGTSDTSTAPTLTWTFPANPSDFTYSFYIVPTGCSNCDIWDVPGNSSGLNNFTYGETQTGAATGQLIWGTDPTAGGSAPTGPLSIGIDYYWGITAYDSNGNQAQSQTWYQP